MKTTQRWALCAVLCLALAGATMASEAEVYKVGDFAVSLAKMVTNKADNTPEQAAAYLKKVGVELGDLDSQVNEEIFVGAFNRLGVNMITAHPESSVDANKAERVFQMFDRNDSLFTGELFSVCHGPNFFTGEPAICVTDADCDAGAKCREIQSIKCRGGASAGDPCMSNADCPGGICSIPPGQLRKIWFASPSD